MKAEDGRLTIQLRIQGNMPSGTGAFVHVVRRLVLDERGEHKVIGSLLDAPIYLPAGDRLVHYAIRQFASAVAASTGRPILVGMTPMNLVAESRVDAGAVNEPARLVLQRILERWRGRLLWSLLYNPGTGNYMLNIQVLQRQPFNPN